MTSRIKVSHVSIHILICSVLRLQYEICILQATNASEGLAVRLWVGPLSSTIQLSSLSGWPQRSTGEATMQVDSVHQAANFAWVGACAVIVESFKHLLRVTAHPQFLMLELWAPMGTCSGHYGNHQELLNRAQSNSSLAMYRKCCFTAYHANSELNIPQLPHVLNPVTGVCKHCKHPSIHLPYNRTSHVMYAACHANN